MKVTIKIKGEEFQTFFDKKDLSTYANFSWRICMCKGRVYLRSDKYENGKAKAVYFHRKILNVPRTLMVDHKNGNGLDNRRSNLRICTHQENMWNRSIQKNNTSGYTGVQKYRDRWISKINVDGEAKYLGIFLTAIDASNAYKLAAKKYFGEYAN